MRSLQETARLAELERVIARGMSEFVAVGNALLTIRDERLYRERGFDSFEDYCRQRWSLGRAHSYRLIAGAKVARLVSPIGDITSEAHARELVPLLDDEKAMVDVWRSLRRRFGPRNVTAAIIRRAVAEHVVTKGGLTGARFSGGHGEWCTPSDIIRRAVRALGRIDLDPCSDDGKNVPATRHYTKHDDGLARPWSGRVFMNPPYGEMMLWTSHLAEAYRAGTVTAAIALVPARTDTAWWSELSSCTVCFLRGRLRFSDATQSAPFPSAVVYFGVHADRFSRAFADAGNIWVPLQ